ncbi:adenylate/guanylate cyclase domain-containing protein [Sulfitobacter mediterraneus]|uniref:adenylate/guanylate cyclase domain-containing protein n=1 Tax=Sulfitobacter mediterraneus TaxID=83219 RepID=UPI0021A78F4F|nr:adenylate/guanylate cyclase domain-containing protein [Sulfitobacter mediterraneus]UWR12011.1 adenylate/guanylate cyclase domain-containing protein [Sulfitobacter mediterraneus]
MSGAQRCEMKNSQYLLPAKADDPWSLLDPANVKKAISIRDYMLGEGRFNTDANDTLTALAEQLVSAGLPLHRCVTIVRILHAINSASYRVWEQGRGAIANVFPYIGTASTEYETSPSALAHETGRWVRFNPQDLQETDFNLVPELKQAGLTDYICAPTLMANGMQNIFSFATQAEAGFSDVDVALLQATFPAIEACQEILVMHRILKEVTRMYVGEEPHERILAGDVHRGEVTRLRSAILFADMREFTLLTSDLSAESATALLNEYYDCVVPAVENNGGEVLKFIGDGVLAIFRAGQDDAKACAKALRAARQGRLAVANRRKSAEIQFDVGVALHFGEVAYGNIGSGARLDYTVIGRDVNLASRLADMCGTLGKTILVSEEIRQHLSDEAFENCGSYELKGLAGKIPVFSEV